MANTTYTFLGGQAALAKLGALEFNSPQEAATHYSDRSDFSTFAGLMGAMGGGAYGGRYGATKGPTGALVGAVLGAAGGYQAGRIPAEFAYDVQHDIGQKARMRHHADVAQLNVASGFPSGMEPSYINPGHHKIALDAVATYLQKEKQR